MNTTKAEFFPGRSHLEGLTHCRGWLCPDGAGLVLPFSLVSVEPGADRYSEQQQLWRDSDGRFWAIRYNPNSCEWYANRLGKSKKQALEFLESIAEAAQE